MLCITSNVSFQHAYYGFHIITYTVPKTIERILHLREVVCNTVLRIQQSHLILRRFADISLHKKLYVYTRSGIGTGCPGK